MSESDAEKIADAIYKVEGGKKAKVPYGILSVKVKNEQEARKACLNTIRNNFKRWKKAGAKGNYLDYLAEIYCPTKGNNLSEAEKKCNKNWRPNLKKILGSDFYEKFRKDL